MKAGANASWWIAWIDPINPTQMVGPIQFLVRSFTPSAAHGSLSFSGSLPLYGVVPGFGMDSLPTIATTFVLWREGSSVAKRPRKRFTSSRATIHRRELLGTMALLTLDFPDYVVADEDERYGVGEWLRAQIETAVRAAFAARETPSQARAPVRPMTAPKIKKGGARGLLDAMSAEPETKPEDERAPQVIPEGAQLLRDINYNTPPPIPAPAGCIWIDGHNMRVSIGGGWWIKQGSFTLAKGAKMGKA